MASPKNIKTTWERATKCTHYIRVNDYLKGAELVLRNTLKKYKNSDKSFLDVFASTISSRSYTGIRKIYTDDKDFFRDYCLSCAININTFLEKENIINLLDPFIYQHKVRGIMDGVLPDKHMNLAFSFGGAFETKKDLDFFVFNNYIYNQTHSTNRDCLVMSIPTDSYYVVDYNEKDYTIRRGYLTLMNKSIMKRRGTHCFTCQKDCKPLFINGIDRFRSST